MKKSIFLAALCLMNVVLMAQDYELRVLTFEDKDAQFTKYSLDYADGWVGRDIATWSDLVDDPQYGGPLTYADYMSAKYHWYDEGNTELAHTFPDNYAYCFWGGGHAISNYWGAGWSDEDRDIHIAKYYGKDYITENAGNDAKLGWFNLQMMVPVQPHSGDNFAVHYGYKDFFTYIENLPEISFEDGKKRVIDHMYVINTNYTLNQLYNGVKSEAGNSFGGNWEGLTDNAWLKIVAYSFDDVDADAYATPKDSVEFYLVKGKNVVTNWQKWDLSALGKVAKVRFNFHYSDEMGGKYGFTIPGYFAYDDVAVRFPIPTIELNTTDNQETIETYNGKVVNVEINRTFKANSGYYTLCVPFDMPASTIGSAYKLESITANQLDKGINIQLTPVENIEAGVPYLIVPNRDIDKLEVQKVKIQNTTGTSYSLSGAGINMTFTGIINGEGTTNGSTEYYIGENSCLYNGVVDKLGLCAFFTMTDQNGQPAGVRARVVAKDNAATGVEKITSPQTTAIKTMIDGQIVIIRNGAMYNLQGQIIK